MTSRGDNGTLIMTEADLRTILDTIPAGVALIDRQARHCYVNSAYWNNLRTPPEQLLGRTTREVIGQEAYLRLRPDPIRSTARCSTARWPSIPRTGLP